MPRFSFANLRVRLFLLVLLAVVPALGLMLYRDIELRGLVVEQVREDSLRLARLAASGQQDSIRDARQLLFAVAQLTEVRQADPATCSAFLSQLLRQYPQYTLLGVIDPAGNMFCSAYPTSEPVNVADQAYFQRVLQTRDFVISDYQTNDISGRAALNFGYPVLSEAGQLQAVILASLDLNWLNQLAAEAQLPEGSTFTVIDRNGTILVRYPDPGQWVGQTVPEAPIVELILHQQSEGTAEIEDVDGLPRLFAFTPLYGSPQSSEVYVSIGIPTAVAFAEINRILFRNLIGLGLVSLLALVAAWLGGDLFFLRWIKAMLASTKRLSAGDLSARTGLPYGRGELSQLARAFDEMAESLERRIAERNQAKEALGDSQRTLLTLLSNLPGMAYRGQHDPERTMQFVSEGCLDLTGYLPAQLIGNAHLSYMRLIHPDDHESVRSKIQTALQAGQSFQIIYRLTTATGEEKWMLEKGQGFFSPAGDLLGLEGFITDTTERVHAYQLLEQRVADRTHELSALFDAERVRRRQADTLLQVASVVGSTLELDEVLVRILDQLRRVVDYDSASIQLLHDGILQVIAARGFADAQEVLGFTFPLSEIPNYKVIAEGRPMNLADAPVRYPAFRQPPFDHIRSWLGVPLRVQEEIIGIITVDRRQAGGYSEEEVRLTTAFADQAALGLGNARLYQQAEQLAVMEERSRLGRDLHDSVTQSLYSLTLFAEVGRRSVEAGDFKQVSDYMVRLGQVAQQSLKEMRLLVYELRPAALETEGLVGAIQQRLDAVEKRAGVEARLLVESMAELPPSVEEGLYRIAQEALNNSLKHAAATSVTVRIRVDVDWAELEVADNGLGFDPGQTRDSGGIGMTSMRERAERLDGSLTIISKPGEGTRLTVSLPTRRSWSRPLLPIDKFSEVL